MPWGTWQHTSTSFKILTTPFLKAIFIILRCCPCIEATPVLTSLWEAVRLSRTFCFWASIRFLWGFFLFLFFFLLHSSRFLTDFFDYLLILTANQGIFPTSCWRVSLFIFWHSFYTKVSEVKNQEARDVETPAVKIPWWQETALLAFVLFFFFFSPFVWHAWNESSVCACLGNTGKIQTREYEMSPSAKCSQRNPLSSSPELGAIVGRVCVVCAWHRQSNPCFLQKPKRSFSGMWASSLMNTLLMLPRGESNFCHAGKK